MFCYLLHSTCKAAAMVPEFIKEAIQASFRLAGLKVVRRKSPHADDQRIFFLHLPKCGGVSINRALSRAFGPYNLTALNATAWKRAVEIRSENRERYKEALLFYCMSMDNVNVVTGHFSWSDRAHEIFCDDWMYITLLRNPVSRWFSHYFYDRYGQGSYFNGIEEDLPGFLHSKRAREMGALYTRRLSDFQTANLDQSVEHAKSNLEKFDVLGVLENINDFGSRLSRKINIDLKIPRKNKSPAENEKKKAEENKELAREVEKICKYDMEVYRHAHEISKC